MDKNNPISEMMQESMAKIRELADTNTIVGQPIQTPDGVTLIPISRIHMGMGGGGTIFGKKREVNPEGNMGAGVGVGVSIDPIAFLVVKDGFTRVIRHDRPGGGDGAGCDRQGHRLHRKTAGEKSRCRYPAGGGLLIFMAVL